MDCKLMMSARSCRKHRLRCMPLVLLPALSAYLSGNSIVKRDAYVSIAAGIRKTTSWALAPSQCLDSKTDSATARRCHKEIGESNPSLLARSERFFVDEEALLAKSTFSIKPDDLLQRAREVFTKLSTDPVSVVSDLADDFVGVGPIAGPLDKDTFVQSIASVDFLRGFPDTNPNYHFLRVDPFEPNRVWVQMRVAATNTGDCMGPPTNKALEFPPESYSLAFDSTGKVTKFTFGYVMDRLIGNTGGLGGAFGYLYGIGRPIPAPEGSPLEHSWQLKALNLVQKFQVWMSKKA